MRYFIALLVFIITITTQSNAQKAGEKMEGKFEWQTASPESQNISSAKLDEIKEVLASRGTKAILVVRNDKIVYEWYAKNHGPDKRHYTASMAKAIVGGISLMLAMSEGLINPDDPAWKYIPQWKDHPDKSKITIRHLVTHSSGIEDARDDNSPVSHNQLSGWKGEFWKGRTDSEHHNPFSIARDQAPLIFTPGTDYHYSNPGMALLSYAVTASFKDSEYKDIRTLLRKRIMEPIGVDKDEWSIGYGKTYTTDDLPLVANWGGGGYTARAVARVGRLMLRRGNWQGEQLIPSKCVGKVVEYADTPVPERPEGNPQPGSGLGWWTNFDGVWESVPRDAYAGAGAGNQILLVIPSMDMIIVRNGSNLFRESDGEGFWGGLEKYLFNPLMEAVDLHPSSPVITGVEWDFADNIIRKAKGRGKDGSDNWPCTWADDDNIYTAYGDGYGFDPIVPKKLGLGFARVIGYPENFTGENIRSDGENTGSGRNGKKASGLLMVNGVIYMWSRNANNKGHHSQLAWSKDYMKSWEWSDWKFEKFGYMTFINFGKNYSGVPENLDDYVYMVSHDDPNAYEATDRFILARAPKNKLMQRNSYEFLVSIDDNNVPEWTKDIDQKGFVFLNPGLCRRSSISYNPGLKRYLWWQQNWGEGGDTRFKGGFAIYDAPQPWGPWTTVYKTDMWDVGPGETGCFPTKWMSEDGKTCYLIFSGNDNFSVRKVEFKAIED
ncbi:serine hydrolase [Candidatus Poribacteria bacterium]|nr:serine hydrolase [Candidatus Poribacteria bacterium]